MLRLTDKQKDMVKLLWKAKKPVVAAGSIRSGKTFGGSFAFALRAVQRPSYYIIGGRTYSSAKRNILRPMFEIMDKLDIAYKFVRSESYVQVEDSRMYIFGGDNEASQDKVQGMTAGGFFGDEALLMPRSFVTQCIARCSNPNPMILLSLNKGDPSHYIKRELIDKDRVILIESKLDDNPHITADTRKMYDETITGHFHARMVENVWTSATGAVFPALHETARIHDHTESIVSCDGAQSGTHAALLMRKEIGNGDHWQIQNEYYSTQELHPSEHAKKMFEIAPEATFVVDPSAANLKRALRDLGAYVINAQNNVEKGIQWTQSAIRRKIVTLADDRPAPNLVAEIAGYVWDEKASERGEDKPVKVKDHACDCLRYFVMHKCPPPDMIPVMKPRGL